MFNLKVIKKKNLRIEIYFIFKILYEYLQSKILKPFKIMNDTLRQFKK